MFRFITAHRHGDGHLFSETAFRLTGILLLWLQPRAATQTRTCEHEWHGERENGALSLVAHHPRAPNVCRAVYQPYHGWYHLLFRANDWMTAEWMAYCCLAGGDVKAVPGESAVRVEHSPCLCWHLQDAPVKHFWSVSSSARADKEAAVGKHAVTRDTPSARWHAGPGVALGGTALIMFQQH